MALSAVTLSACGGQYPLGKRDGGEAGEGGEGVSMSGSAGTLAGTAGSPTGAGGSGVAQGGRSGSDGGGSSGSSGEDAGGAPGAGTGGSSAGIGGMPSGPPILRIRERPTEKVDLLFMIDNSTSMADKQHIMADAVPVLLERLVTPRCLGEDGAPNGTVASSAGECADGTPEFPPIQDIHVGIITSSLGHHGSNDLCTDADLGRTPDDKAQLLGSVRSDIPGNSSGFLTWQPGQDTEALAVDFRSQIMAAGELGCGYESQLEAWYRFLVDPEPTSGMSSDFQLSVRGPANQTLLAQRAEFLRPDSLLAIVMLTDENDCSILDENNTQGWLVGYKGGATMNNWRMPAATASCQEDPNSPCCRPCITAPAPGCGANDVEQCPPSGYHPVEDDNMNLRCFEQRQRFGIDLLYPTERYVNALRDTFIDPRMSGNYVRNPLFAPQGDLPGRARDMVYFAAIVGVPWQDLATEESLNDPRKLEYLSARELADSGRWDVILGDPGSGTPPSDPHMVESIDPRPAGAAHPLLPGVSIGASDSLELTNPINGHEHAVIPEARDDLQYSCIFPLIEPVPCTDANAAQCECNSNEASRNRPLCSFPGPDQDGTQHYAKAYPSLRQLEVMKGIGDQALVASICPKNVTAEGERVLDPNYGYNPAIDGILNRLREAIGPTCIERDLPVESTPSGDRTTCAVVEAERTGGSCACDEARGRLPLGADDPARLEAVAQLEADHQCGGSTGIDCDVFCLCEIEELEGDDLEACQNDTTPPEDAYGFCFIDEQSDDVNPALVRSCPSYAKRALRFTGEGVVNDGAFGLLICPVDD